MSGDTCLITGASRGIGLATAIELARLNTHVAVVCRDAAAAARARNGILAAVPEAEIQLFLADLSIQSQVRRLADEVRERCTSLRLLVHNAAIVTPSRVLTEDGIEMQFAVNHLAPFLLTHLLLDLVKASAPSRIVVVASQVERGGNINFDDLMGGTNYAPLAAYGQSKIANVLFTYSLATRLAGTGVTVNCLHPGVVRTRLLDTIGDIEREVEVSEDSVARRLLNTMGSVRASIRRFLPIPVADDWALTPEDGAKTTVFVATDPSLSGVSGKYFRECRESETSARSHDPAVARRLWEISEKLAGVST